MLFALQLSAHVYSAKGKHPNTSSFHADYDSATDFLDRDIFGANESSEAGQDSSLPTRKSRSRERSALQFRSLPGALSVPYLTDNMIPRFSLDSSKTRNVQALGMSSRGMRAEGHRDSIARFRRDGSGIRRESANQRFKSAKIHSHWHIL